MVHNLMNLLFMFGAVGAFQVPSAVAKMSLDEITKTLMDSNRELFVRRRNDSSTTSVSTLAASDRIDRYSVLPSITNVVSSNDDYLDGIWNWARGVADTVRAMLPYPLYTSTYLNAYVYIGRETNPSDSYDPNLVGDIVMSSNWTMNSVPTWNIWPNGTQIGYYFDFTQDVPRGPCIQSIFREAAIRFEEATNGCIRFIETSARTDDVLVVTANSQTGCFTSLGHVHDNLLNIGTGCINVGTVMHLLGHVLGMAHEDQRPDSREYVKVVDDSIDVLGMSPSSAIDPVNTTKYQFTFTALSGTNTAWETVSKTYPYEFGSLMHNSKFIYSVDIENEPTLTGKYSPQYDDLIGNRGYLTERYCINRSTSYLFLGMPEF